MPKLTTYGTTDSGVRDSHRSYATAETDAAAPRASASQPSGIDATSWTDAPAIASASAAPAVTAPEGIGLVGWAIRSRSRSAQSLSEPVRTCEPATATVVSSRPVDGTGRPGLCREDCAKRRAQGDHRRGGSRMDEPHQAQQGGAHSAGCSPSTRQ